MSEPLRSQSLADQVAQYLKSQLASEARHVGDRLNARKIAAELKVSRTTVNKAIEQLISEGLVEINDSRHPIVKSRPTNLKIHEAAEFEFSNQTDSTYEILLERLLRGDFPPGEIVKERPLAIELGVNPATLRRAAEWLRGDGLLERLPRRGWRVSLLSPTDVIDAYEIRLMLEPMVISAAIERIADNELDDLEEDTDRLIALGEKATVYDRRDADQNFHHKLCLSTGNRMLAETLEPLISKVLLITTVSFRYGRASRSFEEHKVVLEALRNRDEKAAVKAIKLHLRNAMKFNANVWDRR